MSEKKLFEVVVKFYKHFYVEAESLEEAYSLDSVENESDTPCSFGMKFPIELDSIEIRQEGQTIPPNMVAKEEDYE